MSRYTDQFNNNISGVDVPIAGASVYVYRQSDGALAALTSDGTTTLANPVSTDSNGNFAFYAADGYYDLVFYVGGKAVYREDGLLVGAAPNLVVTSATGQVVTSRALLASIASPVNGQAARLTAAGHEGDFVFSTANNAANVTAAPSPATLFVAPATDTTGASGAWVRVYRGSISAKWFDAKGDGATADNAAIQAWLTYAAGISAAKLYLPAGTYLVTNITLPVYSGPQKVIEIAGDMQPATMFGTVGTSAMPTWGSIIKSAATTGGALFKVLSSGGAFANYHLVLRDLNFRTYDNPSIAAIDASKCSQISFYNLQVDTGVYNMQASLPTHSAAIGIMTPLVGNGALSRIINCAVSGYYIGIDVGEHLWGDYLNLSSCLTAMLFESSNDTMLFGRIAAQCCPTVVAINGTCRFDIAQLMIEHVSATQAGAPATAWMAAAEDIRDIANVARATIKVELVVGDVGPVSINNLVFNGAQNVHIARVGGSYENPGFHTSATTSLATATPTNVVWTGGSSGDSGLQIDTDTTHLKCVIPGLYEMTFQGDFASNATGNRKLMLAVNGVILNQDIRPAMGSSLDTILFVRLIVLLAKGDYVVIAGFQDSGGALNLVTGTLTHKRIAAGFLA